MSDTYSARAALGVPHDVEMTEEEAQAVLEHMHTVLSQEAVARIDDADEPPESVLTGDDVSSEESVSL